MSADFAALTTPISDDAAAVLGQPSPFASFWAAFRENKGAVFGLSRGKTRLCARSPSKTASR